MTTAIFDLCGQEYCIENAAARMFWPGKPPSFVCEGHKKKALEVARAMGFELHVEEVAQPTEVRT